MLIICFVKRGFSVLRIEIYFAKKRILLGPSGGAMGAPPVAETEKKTRGVFFDAFSTADTRFYRAEGR